MELLKLGVPAALAILLAMFGFTVKRPRLAMRFCGAIRDSLTPAIMLLSGACAAAVAARYLADRAVRDAQQIIGPHEAAEFTNWAAQDVGALALGVSIALGIAALASGVLAAFEVLARKVMEDDAEREAKGRSKASTDAEREEGD